MNALSPAERQLVAAIDPAPILAHVLDWAAINSGTGHLAGLATMAARLADAFAVLPGDAQLVAPAPVAAIGADGAAHPRAHGAHLLLRVRPDAPRRLLLTGHMDTVFPADHPFQQCAWLDEDTLRGPGTADMKGGIALMLAALVAFEQGRPALGYDVLLNSDEETGSLSSAGLIGQCARGKLAALTFEPALPDGAMAGGRPGSGNFALVIRGRAAHAGRNPAEGRNAVLAAADLALRLAAARRPGLAINVARIEGGGPDNQVPDLAILRCNLRPARAADAAEAEALMATAIAAVAAAHEVSIHRHGHFTRPPREIAARDRPLRALVGQAAGDLGEALHWADTGGVCDGNNIAACAVPVVDTMGARGGAIHSPQEFLQVSSLAARARLAALVLHRLDGEGRA
ncbi:MAG TPA: hydrolase [Novosphingobium sp.]|nr:hydrolase [Novosphingobium sp.]